MSVRSRVFGVLEMADPNHRATRWFGLFISFVISASTLALVLETVAAIRVRFGLGFKVFEIFTVLVFAVEYILRMWSCTTDERYRRPIAGRVRYALTPMVLIDLLAIAPFFVSLCLGLAVDARFLRVLRLLRLVRLLKLSRYVQAVALVGRVFRSRKEELVISVMMVILLLVMASSLMYLVENSVQPEEFSSIPAAMWWAVATLTTVGYGDVTPITPLGKLLGGAITLLAVGLVALPAGILASGFAEAFSDMRRNEKSCPYCGRTLKSL